MEQQNLQVSGIFDSHAHYDDEAFDEDREAILQNIQQNGVCRVMNIGCDLQSSKFAIQLTENYDWIYASAGIHPGNAENLPHDWLAQLAQLLCVPKVRAVGEIGLDYHYGSENKLRQQEVFFSQMKLAEEHKLPVIIHSREATADTLNILKQFPANGVVHCFSGSAETARELIGMGYYIGFTGVVTFQNAHKAKKAAEAVPLNRLLLETDAPYMAPVPCRGKRCTSDLIRYTAQEIANIKGIPVQEVIDAARENTQRLFQIEPL